ncbi:MAG TPA: dTDP-glucose 4,6-dehydratase [Lentisphaeria bacterium]|nr:MAG: dTDP-glucose 4,6-dehydratase [Lentisphaerae bacterium GWF2_38_69]HBM14752.1 dTDP-glucose 4,6-dehydratase [Lentisphaeria bacterium]
MKVLVTGGAGFIGSHIVEALQGEAEITVLDNLRSGNIRNLDGLKANFINGDIRDREIVRNCMKEVDYVFHLAALISVPESMDNPVECVDINNKGMLIVLEEAAKAGVKKLCFSSSCAVYGDNPISPKIETLIPEPKSPYAVSKLDGEYYCSIFTQTGKLNTACLRYFNVFGSRQSPDSAYAAAIPIFVSKAVANKTISIYGDGEQTRDFIYVKDIAKANIYLAKNSSTGVYNAGYGKQTTIKTLAEKIIKTTTSNSNIHYLPPRQGDIKHSLGNIGKLLGVGYKMSSDFDEGLETTIRYFQTKKL